MDAVTHSTDGVVYGGRFRCVKPLKFGRGTATLLGRDMVTGDDVVIKTMWIAAVAPDAHLRLEHEARVLHELASQDFTPVIAIGHQDDQTYVVIPFVSGITLRERLDRGRLSVPELLAVGRAVAATLDRAHERGVFHRDIKPTNIIVDGGVVSRATLVDFGLSRSVDLDVSIRDIPVGTIHYLAPEQAGLLSRPVDERADLYATGIVLFECAAGRVPFQGQGVGEILRAHLCAQPPPLRSLGCNVPQALDEIIQRLLRKDPDDRYQTASALLADLIDLEDALTRGVSDPVVVVGRRDRRRTLAEPAFVGREEELAQLDRHLIDAQQGRGGVVFVEAESGGGKTRLLDEFAQRCARAGAWVLRGQAVDQTAVRPFQLLDGVIQALIGRVESNARFGEHLRKILGEQREAVCEAVPSLARYLKPRTSVSLGPEAHGEVRSLRALSALLDGLGSLDEPAVIVLDDAQWADDLTLKWLEYRQRQADLDELQAATRHVLLVIAFRREEVPADHRLRRLTNALSLVLPPFSATVLRCLSESMAGRLPDEATDLIVRLADGSPFMAMAVLQGLVEIGALVPDGTTGSKSETPAWRIDPDVMKDIRSSRRAAVFLARRLDRLPPATRKLLSVGAVLGKEFGLSLAGDLAGLPEHESAAGCQDAGQRQLIWIQENGARCVFVHDKIREALLARLTDDERRALHVAAATRIESEDPGRVFELAYHFDAAGQSERALPYAMVAAEQARARSALEVAERQYRIAEGGLSRAKRSIQRSVSEGLGDVLMLRGRYQDAEQSLTKAISVADDKLIQARLEGKLGELAFKRGDVRTASVAIERALRGLGQLVPRTSLQVVGLLVGEIAIQVLHTILPRLFVARRSLERSQADLFIVRLYSRLAYAYWFARGALPTLWAHLRELNLVERYPPSKELGQAYANHSAVMTMLPYFKRGMAYAKQGLAIRETLGDVWGVGQSQHFYGLLLFAAARNSEALSMLRESTKRFERTGDFWELNNAMFNIAYCLYRLGDLKGAVDLGQRVIQSGREIGNIRDFAIGLEIWAKASGGKVPRDLVKHELARDSDDVHSVVTVMQAEAVCLLSENRQAEAVAMFVAAQERVRKIGLRNEYVAPIPIWLVTALRTGAWNRSPYHQAPQVRAWQRPVRRLVRQALRVARRYRNNLPHALREAGLLAAMRGKLRKARRYLDESIMVAEQQGAKFEHAQTLWARGQVGSQVGWADAAEDLDQGRTALRALGAYWVLGEAEPAAADRPMTPALIERFDALLQAGRHIASALTRDAVWAAVRDAALALLRGEECLIVCVAGGVINVTGSNAGEREARRPQNHHSPFGQSYSRSLVERAIQTRRPAVASLGLSEDPSESIVLSGARSVLCAPISVRGEVVACFYVTNRHVDGLFGENEERLAELVGTLAGAALENVEGVAKAESDVITGTTAGLAHAIKNPVAVLRAYLGLLRSGAGHGDRVVVDQYLHTMEGALDRIGELVGHLQRVQVTTSQKTAMPLERLIGEAMEEVGQLFPEASGYRVECDVASNAPALIVADGEQLRLVLVNLLVNANQAMPRGGCVRIKVRPDSGGGVEIVVTDEGAGIPSAIEPRLFEPFVTSKSEGTGLGLWVCKKIVEEQHQGRIEVIGVPGGGTSVSVTLPVGQRAGMSSAQ